MSAKQPKKHRVSFLTKDGTKRSFLAKIHKPKKAAACQEYNVGDRITRKTRLGRTVTMERTRKRGRNGNLCWKVVKNTKTKKAKKSK